MNRRAWVAPFAVIAALGLSFVGGKHAGADAKTAIPAASSADVQAARSVSRAFAALAAQVSPSVVRITVMEHRQTGEEQEQGEGGAPDNPFGGTPFERFFHHDERSRSVPVIGMGSGVVLDDRGDILTNDHVVKDADQVKVAFVDGTEVKGRVLGTDPKSDLAVVKVDGVKVTPARFGDSDKMAVGESVMAIGNPFGLDHSVTVGVLSATNRSGFQSGHYEDFLQTDASINPGNSGGPLVNLSGEVIGINTMIAGLGTGVGFAVPSSMAQPIARQLIEHGKVIRPYIGIVMQSVTPELHQSLGNNAPEKGALVSEVKLGSPAARAGLKPGDVVIAVNGERAKDSRAVQRDVLQQKVGSKVELTVWQEGQQKQLAVKTAELPASKQEGATKEEGGGAEKGKIGIGLESLGPRLAEELGLPRATRGAVVTSVREGSPALAAGLREGDVIVEVDRKPVKDAAAAARLLQAAHPGGHLVRVRRASGALFVVIPSAR